MKPCNLYKRYLLIMIMILALAPRALPQIHNRTITVVLSNDYSVFQTAAQEFWKYLKQNNVAAGDLADNLMILTTGKIEEITDNPDGNRPDLILAVGNNAAKAIKENIHGIPVVFAMVFEPEKYGIIEDSQKPEKYFSGVTADISLTRLMEFVMHVFGDVKRIGTIFSRNSTDYANELKRASTGKDISLNTQLVRDTENIVRAARSLQAIDLFWMVPDPVVYSTSNRQVLFSWLSEREIPILVPSQRFLMEANSGDLAIAIDPVSCGKQVGEIAVQFLINSSAYIPVQEPHDLKVFIKKGSKIAAPEDAIIIESPLK